jgi:hypothetical protein
MIASARGRDTDWDEARAARVREGALRRREVRSRRDRLLRRGALVAGGAGLLVLALLRAASSAPADPSPALAVAPTMLPTQAPAPAPTAEALAARAMALNDAGYARD